MRGEKGAWHGQPADPPRRRANKRRGRGTYDNDSLPVCAVIGRQSGKVRLRVVKNTQGKTLCPFVEQFTQVEATI
jgi:transposase